MSEELKREILKAIQEGIQYDSRIGNHVIIDKTAYIIKTCKDPMNNKYGSRYAYEFTDRSLAPEEYIWLE